MSLASPTLAPIERVTIPLRPRTPAGCCDLAVMYCGRHLLAVSRLYLAVAGPCVALVYGLARFVGTDLSIPLITVIVASKVLGALTVAAVARTAFGEPFEVPSLDRWAKRTRFERVHDFSRNLLTAVAWLAGGILVVSAVEDVYGKGVLASLPTDVVTAIVCGLAGVLLVRSLVYFSDRHAPHPAVTRGIWRGLLLRVIFALPVILWMFELTRVTGIVLAIFWLPAMSLVALWFSYDSERRALLAIDPALQDRKASKAISLQDLLGPAFLIVSAAAFLFCIIAVGFEVAMSKFGLQSPLIGPISDYFDLEFFEPGLALSLIASNPLFAATCVAAGLFAYQVGRIAWFFAYVDARVRSDGWDQELLLAREAKRLEDEWDRH